MDSGHGSFFHVEEQGKHPTQWTTDHYSPSKTKQNGFYAKGDKMMLADEKNSKEKKEEDSCLKEDSVSNSSLC